MPVTATAPRACPRDGTPLERSMVLRPFPTMVDRCPSCRGAFATALDVEAATYGRSASSFPLSGALSAGAGGACPACGDQLQEREAPARFASCPSCEGAWIASGHLRDLAPPFRLADVAKPPAPSAAAPPVVPADAAAGTGAGRTWLQRLRRA